MANILLTINKSTRNVSKGRDFAGVQLENLQDKFVVKFSDGFLNGNAVLEYEVNGEKYLLDMTKDTSQEMYSIDISNVLITEEGIYPFQIRISSGSKVFKSQIFYLKIYPSINAVDAPPDMPDWQQWVIEYVEENGGKIDTISVNGDTLPISPDKNVDITVPTKTSDLTNDGDGESAFATQDYVAEYGGKIDKIQKNGVDLPIENKTVNIPVPEKVTDLDDASDYPTVDEVNTAFENVSEAIQNVDSKLQSGASAEDPCTTESFVNSSINAIAAFYITKNAQGDPFATKAELDNTSVYYSGGEVRVPTRNDYCLIIADITKAHIVEGYSEFTTTSQYVDFHVIYNNIDTLVTSENKDSLGIVPGTTPCYYSIPTTRYTYQNNQWEYQYIINDTSLTARQVAAINSGITAALVSLISTNQSNIGSHVANTSNPHNVTKAQVGLGSVDNTSDLNKPISSATQNALNAKLDKPSVDATTGQILGQVDNTPTWVNPPQAPVQSVSLGGTNLPPDSNGNVNVPAVEAEVMEVEEVEEVDVVTSVDSSSSDTEIPTAKAVYTGLSAKADASSTTQALNSKADLADIAEEYDDTQTYAVGDVVIYEGDVYKCNTAVETAESFDSIKWTKKNVEELIEESVPTDYVSTGSTQQLITGTKNFRGGITVLNASNDGLDIGVTDLYTISRKNSPVGIQFGLLSMQLNASTVILANNNFRPTTNNSFDLGSSSYKWKNLYLSGGLLDGKTSYKLTIPDTTNWTGDKVIATTDEVSLKQDATDNNLNTASKTIVGAINEVDAVAKGCNKALAYASYSALITALNAASATELVVGQSFYIQTLNVPDLWVMAVESTSITYTYVDDATFITATGASGGCQVGYYKIAQLETLKQDISNLVTTNTTQTISAIKTFSATPLLNNAVYLRGKNSSSTAKNIIGITSNDNIVINNENSGTTLVGGTMFGPTSGQNNVINLGAPSTNQWNNAYIKTIYQNGKQVANAEDIPTSINGMSGGTLTSPLTLSGGDASTASKLILDNATAGQITNNGTQTLFGFTSNNSTTLSVGHSSYAMALRGSGTRPKFNGNDIALSSDIDTAIQNAITTTLNTPV